MAILKLSGSVGDGGKNSPDDVKKVVDRFVELGYKWVAGVTKGNSSELVRTIRLIQSMVKGSGKIDKGNGKMSLHGDTHRWLAAQNAPQWVRIYGQSGLGWTTTGDYSEMNGGYTTSWLLDRLKWTGMAYRATALLSVSDAPPLWVRECSHQLGKNPTGHKSHETGIDIDIRLPLLPPHTNEWFQLKAHNYTKLFHYEAAVVQCQTLKKHMNSKYIFFNDPRFTDKLRLTTNQPNHSEHYHVRINPPARIDGVYM